MRLLAAVMLIAGCSSEVEHACTLIGCSELTFELGEFPEVSITPTSMGHASVDVCLNDVCSPVTLEGLPELIQAHTYTSTFGTPQPVLRIMVTRVDANTLGIRVQIAGGDEDTLQNGDRYRITVTSSSGEIVTDRAWAVDYKTTYPNGPDCGVCRSAVTTTEL